MKTLRWAVVLGSFGLTPWVAAQESTKPEAEAKASEPVKPDAKPNASGSPSSEAKSTKSRIETDLEAVIKRQEALRAQIDQRVKDSDRVATEARAQLQKAQDQARVEFQRAQDQARAEFQRAQDRARSELQEAQTDLQRAFGGSQGKPNAGSGSDTPGKPTPRRVFSSQGQGMGKLGHPTQSSGGQQGQSNRPGYVSRVYNLRTNHSPSNFAQTFGLDFVPADPVLKAQLDLTASEGLVVINVVAEGPADKAGIKKNDVIAKLDGKSVHIVAEAQSLIADGSKPTVAVNLFRAGKPVDLTWTKPELPESKEPYYIGVVLNPVDATLRAQLTMLPDDAGLIVGEVTPNSPAAKGEAQKYDIVLKVNDQAIKTNEGLIEQIQKTKGEPIKLAILRKGKSKILTVTPERRPAAMMWGEDASLAPNEVLQQVLKGQQVSDGPMYFTWTPGVDKALSLPGMGVMTTNGANFPDEVRDRLQKQIKDLGKQMEDLQKAIEVMNKGLKQRPPVEVKDVKEKDEK